MCHIKATGISRRTCGPLMVVVAAAVFMSSCGIPAQAGAAAPPKWRPDVRAAREYLSHRGGDVSFAVRTERRLWGHHRVRTVPSASVLKAMLMVAYLNRRDVRDRPLRRHDLRLLRPMIRRSDNTTATI